MSQRLVQAAGAVRPLRGSPANRFDWAALGLPDTGWMMVTDKELCLHCPSTEPPPCVNSCGTAHNLEPEARMTVSACLQCDPAPCGDACAAGAITRTAQGVREIDQEVCNGCRFCLEACEHGALLWVDPYHVAAPARGAASYSSGRPHGELPNTVAKCTFCSYRLEEGALPVCVEACPLNAIWVGNLDRNTATNGVKVARLSDIFQGRRFQLRAPGQHVVHLEG